MFSWLKLRIKSPRSLVGRVGFSCHRRFALPNQNQAYLAMRSLCTLIEVVSCCRPLEIDGLWLGEFPLSVDVDQFESVDPAVRYSANRS